MMNANLFRHVADAVLDPGKVAIDFEGHTTTYGELLALSGQMANGLLARGVVPGDRVAAHIEKSVAGIVLYLACARLGAVYLPLNTGYTLTELAYFIADSEPSLIVCDPAQRAGIEALVAARRTRVGVETLDQNGEGSLMALAAAQSPDCAIAAVEPDDLAALLYTSGTTGRSKGAMLTHGNLVSNALTLREAWGFTAQDLLIHALPIYHTHGLFVASNVTFLAGGTMLFCRKFDAEAVMRLMPRATTLMGVPTFYTRLLKHPGLTRETVAHMRLFVSGSAPLLAETHRAWSARTGHAILERYGMTETGMNTSNPYAGERIAGTVGFPLPGVELRITDPEQATARGPGEVGMIEVRGPNVFKGYWRMPERTAAEIRADGFFITGDLGTVDEAGYLQIVGRGRDLIITGGLNVYPKEVEAEIDLLPGVHESAVFGVPHPDLGEGVTAVAVREAGAQVDEAAVLAGLQGRLARFKLPRRVIVVDELPRNTMGKVQKNHLRQDYAALYAVDAEDSVAVAQNSLS